MKVIKANIHNKLHLVFWLILSVFFSAAIVIQLNHRMDLQKGKDEVLAEIAAQEELKKELQKELEFYDSDFYVERIARERLGMVKSDETVFYNDLQK